jgi:hypothetical protein
VTFEALAAFVSGEEKVLNGRWITLKDVSCAL